MLQAPRQRQVGLLQVRVLIMRNTQVSDVHAERGRAAFRRLTDRLIEQGERPEPLFDVHELNGLPSSRSRETQRTDTRP